MTSKITSTRRQFLKAGSLLTGGLLISFMVPPAVNKRLLQQTEDNSEAFVPNAYLSIAPDDTIRILIAKAEMGQGIWTTLSMLIGEELDADWSKFKIEHAPPGKDYIHTVFGVQITGGSSTTWSEFDRYRQAGALARIMLIEAAAKRLGIKPQECRTENGEVIAGNKRIRYGSLAGEASSLPVRKEPVPLRAPSSWKYIGKGVKRLDAPEKVDGSATFGMDVQFPGLLTAVVAHAPVYGSKVKKYDDSKTRLIPGVRRVVQIPTGVAVIADHFWAAKKGRDVLSVEWDLSDNKDVDSLTQLHEFRNLVATKGTPAAQAGNVDAGFSKAVKIVESEYTFPYLAHAPMEPLNVTVKLSKYSCEIWTGTQMPMAEQSAAAKILNLKTEQVTVHTLFLGGGFGRRANPSSDFVSEAVHVANESGLFIKMVWTREDDVCGAYYRPSFVHRVRAGVDANGKIVAWQHNLAGQSVLTGTPFEGGIVKGIDPTSVEGVSDSPYLHDVPDYYVGLHSPKINIPVLWYRSVGHTHTAAVMESMIDELAHTAGKDPLTYRRELLKNHPRHLAALNLAAQKAGWDTPLPEGRYRGIAVHESFLSFVAHVVELSVDNKGQIKVHRVVSAIDCGLAVNPDGVRAQIESGIIFGLSAAIHGKITLSNGKVQQSNFHDYRISRINEVPLEIEVHIVESTGKMGGAGECGVPPLAPAIANAVFAATGKRLRNYPFGNVA
jgi:isoquinoline 1-oxidoreductase subunit beta